MNGIILHRELWADPENYAMLGKMPDTVIANRLRISPSSVHRARKKFGIEAFPKTKEAMSEYAKKGRQTVLEQEQGSENTLLGGAFAHAGTRLTGKKLERQRLIDGWGR